jgi:hypothetical protein
MGTQRKRALETRAARLRLTARRKHYVLEEELFARRRDVLSTLDLVFMDTTSLYFEGAGGQTLGRRGFSKDHRPDLNQMILAVLLDGDGQPVCTEMWPGNTADVTSLIPAVDRLRKRFSINRVCVVADRGMISAETIAQLETRKLLYILGVREPSDRLVRELVLDALRPVLPDQAQKGDRLRGQGGDAGRTALHCLPQSRPDEEGRGRQGRDPGRGGRQVRRRLRAADQRPSVAARSHARPQTIVDGGAGVPHLFETRPIYHKLDETIRGHVSCSFLALVLKKELEDRIALGAPAADGEAAPRASWPDILADLESLTETDFEQDGKRFLLRSAPRPAASLALRAVGVALPPTVRQLAEA